MCVIVSAAAYCGRWELAASNICVAIAQATGQLLMAQKTGALAQALYRSLKTSNAGTAAMCMHCRRPRHAHGLVGHCCCMHTSLSSHLTASVLAPTTPVMTTLEAGAFGGVLYTLQQLGSPHS